MTLCTSIDTLAMTYLDDELADEELRDFELHLLDCAACRGRVDSEREALAELRRRLAPPPTPDIVRARLRAALDAEDAAVAASSKWRQWALPGAASVVAVAALAVFVFFRAPEQRAQGVDRVVANQQMRSAQVTQPVVTGGDRQLNLQRVATYETRLGNIDATTFEYYVDLPSGIRILAKTLIFDARNIDMRVGDRYVVDGLEFWVNPETGMIAYEGARGVGYVFMAPQLSTRDALDLVSGYLLPDTGVR